MARYSRVTACLAAFLYLHMVTTASNAAVVVQFDPGTTNVTSGLSGFGTTGDLMAGMEVTAYFSDNTSETVTWADIGFPTGEAAGTGWSLAQSGDTFSFDWVLVNTSGKSIDRILIDAGVVDTLFDTFFGGDFGSDGSFNGWDFEVTSGLGSLDIVATYRDEIQIGTDPPVGDIYRLLDIAFNNPGGFASGSTLTFLADTDNALFAGDITPLPQPVPEPTAYLVWLVVGLTTATVARRVRRKHA